MAGNCSQMTQKHSIRGGIALFRFANDTDIPFAEQGKHLKVGDGFGTLFVFPKNPPPP